jgi:Cache domain
MPGWLSKLMSAQFARASDTATPAKFFSLERLFLVCAVTLALIVVGSASLIVLNLRDRVTYENERALTNSTLIIAKQIEQAFAAVEAAQKEFTEDVSRLRGVSRKTFETSISRYDVHLKLRDKAVGIPYVGALIIYNADGKLINYSRQWPLPDINIADRDYFNAAKSDPASKSILSQPVRNRATGSWVTNLVRKISAPDGEFLGVISASFELGFLQKYFSEISADPDSSFALFRNDGTLLARFPQNDVDIGRRWPDAVALKLTAIANRGVGMITA